MRGFWYRVRVRGGAALRLGLCSSPGRPPRAACSSAGHHRVSLQAQRLISGATAAPRSPWAARWALAAGWLQLQAREPRSKRPEALHLRTPCPGPGLSAPPRPAQRPAAVGRIFSLSLAPAARARFSRAAAAAQVRDQLSLSSSAPLGPPPPRPRLLTLLRAPPASPSPRLRGRAFAAQHPLHTHVKGH